MTAEDLVAPAVVTLGCFEFFFCSWLVWLGCGLVGRWFGLCVCCYAGCLVCCFFGISAIAGFHVLVVARCVGLLVGWLVGCWFGCPVCWIVVCDFLVWFVRLLAGYMVALLMFSLHIWCFGLMM